MRNQVINYIKKHQGCLFAEAHRGIGAKFLPLSRLLKEMERGGELAKYPFDPKDTRYFVDDGWFCFGCDKSRLQTKPSRKDPARCHECEQAAKRRTIEQGEFNVMMGYWSAQKLVNLRTPDLRGNYAA